MNTRCLSALAAASVACAGLSGCGERPQTLNSSGTKQDAQAFQGTGLPYAAPGWTAGDKVSWEQQLKTRTQSGQNEYAKVTK